MTSFYVYLLASRRHGTLYLGVTNDLVRRIHEHKTTTIPGFTRRYGVDRLVWFEIYDDPVTAISRAKELKKWRRDWKVRLHRRAEPGVARPLRNDRQVTISVVIPGRGAAASPEPMSTDLDTFVAGAQMFKPQTAGWPLSAAGGERKVRAPRRYGAG
jgi:putative endonuclease